MSPTETHSAMPGAFATLGADAQSENPDREHGLVKQYQYPEVYGVCSCGARVDAADEDQLAQLHRDHANHERTAKVYRPAAQRGLAASRQRLRETTARKSGVA